MKQTLPFVASAILAVMTPNSASAVDFSFIVPIQMQNLSEGITNLNVECKLFAGSSEIQTEHVSLGLSATQVQVNFTIDRGRTDPRDVTSYLCRLLDRTGTPISPGSSVLARLPQGDRYVKLIDETQPYRLRVSGDIPSQ